MRTAPICFSLYPKLVHVSCVAAYPWGDWSGRVFPRPHHWRRGGPHPRCFPWTRRTRVRCPRSPGGAGVGQRSAGAGVRLIRRRRTEAARSRYYLRDERCAACECPEQGKSCVTYCQYNWGKTLRHCTQYTVFDWLISKFYLVGQKLTTTVRYGMSPPLDTYPACLRVKNTLWNALWRYNAQFHIQIPYRLPSGAFCICILYLYFIFLLRQYPPRQIRYLLR